MTTAVRIVTVDAGNLEAEGFFRYKSKRDSDGHRQKRDWVAGGIAHGLRVRWLHSPLAAARP